MPAEFVGRISAFPIPAVIFRLVLRIPTGAEKDIGVVVDAVSIEIHRAAKRLDAEILRRIGSAGQQTPMNQCGSYAEGQRD